MGEIMENTKAYPIDNKSYDDWLVRTSLEAEAESEKNGWVSNEKAKAIMAAHKQAFFKRKKIL
jgi:hypothetical protein